jgi:hypothetical protein
VQLLKFMYILLVVCIIHDVIALIMLLSMVKHISFSFWD